MGRGGRLLKNPFPCLLDAGKTGGCGSSAARAGLFAPVMLMAWGVLQPVLSGCG